MQLSVAPTTTQPQPSTEKPSLRDLADLVNIYLPGPLVMLTPMPELERRCQEIDLTHPRFRQETPLVLTYERQRRQRLANPEPRLA